MDDCHARMIGENVGVGRKQRTSDGGRRISFEFNAGKNDRVCMPRGCEPHGRESSVFVNFRCEGSAWLQALRNGEVTCIPAGSSWWRETTGEWRPSGDSHENSQKPDARNSAFQTQGPQSSRTSGLRKVPANKSRGLMWNYSNAGFWTTPRPSYIFFSFQDLPPALWAFVQLQEAAEYRVGYPSNLRSTFKSDVPDSIITIEDSPILRAIDSRCQGFMSGPRQVRQNTLTCGEERKDVSD